MWGILSSREHTLCSTTTCTDHSHAVQSTAPGGKCLTRKARDKKEAYLLGWGVFNSMWVVIVIDDVQVLHCITRKEAAELHVEWCFPSPLGIHGEVGWLPIFHTWKDTGKGETEAGEVSLLEPVWQAPQQQPGTQCSCHIRALHWREVPRGLDSAERSRQPYPSQSYLLDSTRDLLPSLCWHRGKGQLWLWKGWQGFPEAKTRLRREAPRESSELNLLPKHNGQRLS